MPESWREKLVTIFQHLEQTSKSKKWNTEESTKVRKLVSLLFTFLDSQKIWLLFLWKASENVFLELKPTVLTELWILYDSQGLLLTEEEKDLSFNIISVR